MATITVMEWERVLLYVDGRFSRVLEPGRHRYRAKRARLVTVDTRARQMTVPGQELITADGVSLRVSVVARWQVVDPVRYTGAAEHPNMLLYAAIQEAVRGLVATVTLEGVLADRETLTLDPAALGGVREELGVSVTALTVRDLMLPGELRRAAMDVVVARERGKAALEEARAEAAALRSLANTARLIDEHPALLQLRTLQLAAEQRTTLVLDPRPALPQQSA